MPRDDPVADDPMPPDSAYRQLVRKIGEAAEPRSGRKLSRREALNTQMLGVLSVSLGLAAMVELLPACCHVTGIRRIIFTLPGIADIPLSATTAPSSSLARSLGIALVGQWLGMAGIFLARRRCRAISPLSALGTVLCLIPLFPAYIALVLLMIVTISPILLATWGVIALMRLFERSDHRRGRG